MIKPFIARAMQIAMLEKEQIEKLHTIEKSRNHLLMNWNIQEFFNTTTICERLEIPLESIDQINHNDRIDQEIKDLNLTMTAENYEEKLDWYHAFDWNIHHNKGRIVWEYSGSNKRGNLKARLKDE